MHFSKSLGEWTSSAHAGIWDSRRHDSTCPRHEICRKRISNISHLGLAWGQSAARHAKRTKTVFQKYLGYALSWSKSVTTFSNKYGGSSGTKKGLGFALPHSIASIYLTLISLKATEMTIFRPLGMSGSCIKTELLGLYLDNFTHLVRSTGKWLWLHCAKRTSRIAAPILTASHSVIVLV